MCLATTHIKCKWEIIIYMRHILINTIISSFFSYKEQGFVQFKIMSKAQGISGRKWKRIRKYLTYKSSKQGDQFIFVFTYWNTFCIFYCFCHLVIIHPKIFQRTLSPTNKQAMNGKEGTKMQQLLSKVLLVGFFYIKWLDSQSFSITLPQSNRSFGGHNPKILSVMKVTFLT